jgi:hypothetical protein
LIFKTTAEYAGSSIDRPHSDDAAERLLTK